MRLWVFIGAAAEASARDGTRDTLQHHFLSASLDQPFTFVRWLNSRVLIFNINYPISLLFSTIMTERLLPDLLLDNLLHMQTVVLWQAAARGRPASS